MAVLTYGQRKRIEARIRDYHRYRGEIAEWRDLAIRGHRKDGQARRQPRGVSDPTAVAAIRLASPPKRIREKELWVETIDAVRERYKGTGKGELFETWFWAESQRMGDAAEKMHVSERLLRYWISEIVISVAILAAQRGIFVLT